MRMPELSDQIWAALIGGLSTVVAAVVGALIVNTGIGRVFSGPEAIQVAVAGFNGGGSPVAIVQNYGKQPGTLLPDAEILALASNGNVLRRFEQQLNSGASGGLSQNPFGLAPGKSKRYFIRQPDEIPAGTDVCALEIRVIVLGGIDLRRSLPFDCNGDE